MKKELAARYAALDDVIEQMNREALQEREIPFIRREAYLHFCHVDQFLKAYTRKLRPQPEQYEAWRDFVYEDTLELKGHIGTLDLYAFTFYYFKFMTFRTGNLDTPDDCVEILDLAQFEPYMAARKKQMAGQRLNRKEEELTGKHLSEVMACMAARLPEEIRCGC